MIYSYVNVSVYLCVYFPCAVVLGGISTNEVGKADDGFVRISNVGIMID